MSEREGEQARRARARRAYLAGMAVERLVDRVVENEDRVRYLEYELSRIDSLAVKVIRREEQLSEALTLLNRVEQREALESGELVELREILTRHREDRP